MSLIVQKYGGTSVGNPDRIKNVAARVAKYRAQGDQIVVVVSAMSGVTDNLIKLAKEIMPLPSEREMDVLLATGDQQTIALTAIALHALNVPAVSLTGPQAGIVTVVVHTKAKIHNITPKKVHELLKAGNVVIVAGFQGETPEGHEGRSVPLIFMLHYATNGAVNGALKKISRLPVIKGKPVMIRVENFE